MNADLAQRIVARLVGPGGRSVSVGAYDLAAGLGAKGPPDRAGNAGLDESNAAVGQTHVGPARVTAAGRVREASIEKRQVAERAEERAAVVAPSFGVWMVLNIV